MKVPDDWPKPKEGQLLAVCKAGYGSGNWYVFDHTGEVIANRDVFTAAKIVNKYNNDP